MPKRNEPTLTVFRVQDAKGRGPWKPGFSQYWVDGDRSEQMADMVSAFGLDWKDRLPYGWACGCACRSFDGLLHWFTFIERERLARMGYQIVSMNALLILAENSDQVIFARPLPLTIGIKAIPWMVLA